MVKRKIFDNRIDEDLADAITDGLEMNLIVAALDVAGWKIVPQRDDDPKWAMHGACKHVPAWAESLEPLPTAQVIWLFKPDDDGDKPSTGHFQATP